MYSNDRRRGRNRPASARQNAEMRAVGKRLAAKYHRLFGRYFPSRKTYQIRTGRNWDETKPGQGVDEDDYEVSLSVSGEHTRLQEAGKWKLQVKFHDIIKSYLESVIKDKSVCQ